MPSAAVHFVRTWRERTCDGKLLREIARVHIARCEAGHMQAIARTHETHIANAACAPNGPLFQPRFSEKVGPPDFQKIVKAPALLLYLRVRWRPLSGIGRLTEFGGVRLTVVMTFPERTDVVLGRSRRDFGSVFLVARRMPLGDGVRDDLGRGGSHQSEVGITNRLSLNSLSLRYQIVSCVLQLGYEPVDLCNRRGSDLLNERCDLRVSFRRRRTFCMSEIANFPFNSQICGYGLEARDVKFHKVIPRGNGILHREG